MQQVIIALQAPSLLAAFFVFSLLITSLSFAMVKSVVMLEKALVCSWGWDVTVLSARKVTTRRVCCSVASREGVVFQYRLSTSRHNVFV